MRFLAFFPLIFLAACAVPDINSFKQSSLALSTGLKDNQTALVQSGLAIAEKLGNPKDLKERIRYLKDQEEKVNEAAAVLTAYANAVASLASSGQDGAEAAQSMLNNITTTIGNVSGKTAKLPGILGQITELLGKIVQQKQNKKLYEIMKDLEGDINKFADTLSEAKNGEESVVNALANKWRDGRQDLIDYHRAYENLEGQIQVVDGAAASKLTNDIKDCQRNKNCNYVTLSIKRKDNQDLALTELAALQKLMKEIQPFEEGYQAQEKEIAAWKVTAKARIAAIPDLAAAWKRDHATIITYLRDCTNMFDIFKSKCGAFSSGNLELFGVLLGKAAFPF